MCLVTSCSSAEMDVAAKGWAAALKEGPSGPRGVSGDAMAIIFNG